MGFPAPYQGDFKKQCVSPKVIGRLNLSTKSQQPLEPRIAVGGEKPRLSILKPVRLNINFTTNSQKETSTMNRPYILPLVVFISSIALLLSIPLQSTAATFSGRVVDEVGKPVANLRLGLPAFRVTTPQDRDEPVFLPSQQGETNEVGKFSISDITSPSVKLMLLPEGTADYELRSAKIEGMIFYLDPYQFRFGGLTFAIVPGADVKDVEITVRARMRIRGRVVSTNGNPLRNARVNLRVERRDIDGTGGGGGGRTTQLDEDGYFVRYLNEPAYYTVSVAYQGQSAKSEEILIEDGQRYDDLVLTLDVEPSPEPEQADVPMPNVEHFKAAWERDRQGMWAVNPENRHAYKRIYCETREEAYTQAAAQGAHLVAINDAAEQEWILEVFGKENFWIGITDASKEDNLYWDNGEPVTYSNWALSEKKLMVKKSDHNDETHQNYTVLIGLTGQWQETRQDGPLAHLTERAILEKERFTIVLPEVEVDGKRR